jgi:hypothetical protein
MVGRTKKIHVTYLAICRNTIAAFIFFAAATTSFADPAQENYPGTIFPRDFINGGYFGVVNNGNTVYVYDITILDNNVTAVVKTYDVSDPNVPAELVPPVVYRGNDCAFDSIRSQYGNAYQSCSLNTEKTYQFVFNIVLTTSGSPGGLNASLEGVPDTIPNSPYGWLLNTGSPYLTKYK